MAGERRLRTGEARAAKCSPRGEVQPPRPAAAYLTVYELKR